MSTIVWDITSYCPLKVNRCFGVTCRLGNPPAFTLLSCLAYSTLKMDVPRKRQLPFSRLHGIISQKIVLFKSKLIKWLCGVSQFNSSHVEETRKQVIWCQRPAEVQSSINIACYTTAYVRETQDIQSVWSICNFRNVTAHKFLNLLYFYRLLQSYKLLRINKYIFI
jgi:hypothetical protein